MTQKVFFSYAQQDKHLVEPTLKKLSQAGISELEITSETDDPVQLAQAGENLRTMILDHVKSASQVVVLWSEHAANSQYVQYELGLADALDKPIIVVKTNRSAPQLPSNLAETAFLELDNVVS